MYSDIAQIYDRLNSDIDYNVWVQYIENIFKKFGCKPCIILELACGTGSFAVLMSKKGYEMICSDISEQMLLIAREKAENQKQDILFLQQDMSSFELYGTVGAIVCLLDSLNHLTSMEDVKNMIALSHNYLDSGGLLIFDINTINKLKTIYGDNVFYVDDEEFTCLWQCQYDPVNSISDIEFTLFLKEGELYKRYDDSVTEKAYEINELKRICTDTGFECLGVFDEFTFNTYNKGSERVFFVCKKRDKDL